MPLLSDLWAGAAAIPITALSEDSRTVKPGTLFAAFKGTKSDGTQLIPQAIKQGAAAILTDHEITDLSIPVIVTPNPREALGQIAAKFYAPLPETIIAVTGTNGKTSTVHFVRQLWHLMGLKSASLGTIGVIENEQLTHDGAMTTPDTVTLYKTLHDLKTRGINHVAMEASSHGLHQSRLAGLKLTAGGFTNLTRDHLDYHGTMEAYFEAKALLFKHVQKAAVVNADIAEYSALKNIAKQNNLQLIDFGTKADILKISQIKSTATGFSFTLNSHHLNIPLLGLFQIENILCAIGLIMGCGVKLDDILPHLTKLTSVPGRMEKVGEKNGASVIIDYAHTPDALEKLLRAARPHATGNIILVFGCGGDRDKGKRPLMGALANAHANTIIVTDDNPRTENADQIRKEILATCPNAKEIGDRTKAIQHAISLAKPGDVVVIAGKGHEEYQIIGATKHPFSDKKVASACL